MAWYSEYKSKYRLRADIDERFNDYPREELDEDGEGKGKYCDNDVYISCAFGRVYWYSRGIFEAWVGDITNQKSRKLKFNSILKAHKKIIIQDSIMQGDGEGTFRFKKSDLPTIVSAMGGDYKTCINRSPFSVKNLEKEEYEIPQVDLEKYNKLRKAKEIKMSDYRKIYSGFAESEFGWDSKEYGKQCKIQMVSGKELFHKMDKWEEFITFIKTW